MTRLLALVLLAWPALAAPLTLKTQTLADTLALEGLVEASNSATVSAQTSGRVAQVLVDVGDQVPAGAVILRIHALEQSQALDRAKASLAASQAALTQARQEWQRVSSLVAQKLLPQAELDKARASLDSASAGAKAAKAAVATADEQLAYTEIKAPYSGVVSARLVEPGELVLPGTPLMSGFDPASLRLHLDLPASLASAARQYQWARVAGQAPDKLLFFPTADGQSGTVRLRLQLGPAFAAMPGQWLKVVVKVGEHQGLLVPKRLVKRQGELQLVRMAGGSWRAVRLGAALGDQLEVLSGLGAGEELADD
ncbi:efflux RND transporter periplasmic adaptor subunit [Gallaecimonas xiamenensis]|uniref:RND family efflux transporter MFP subunit n=1 Tax=Gallaecimonas xiamenensis 3-C-1 TaxID=745411 RepID=K2JNR9_9GAMM|nr:efflux RND transporter periplasmic adaptor subunit [Gallaecimonas xiamenensis]EKE76132.1 RND family efflux transporter MFP subunit [Gallaecimonas xiamenensis 3-C-1]